MDKKESIYSISRGILNRKMIDLAENAGAEFSLNKKIWDVTLSDATLHIGETERGGKIKTIWYLVLMALFQEFATMQRQSMFNYSQEF
jgi:kynurenine 3-monooxygenase